MDIIVARQGNIEVDDAIDGFDIQAARSNIGADESAQLAVAKTLQLRDTQGLRHVAVQLSNIFNALLRKPSCHLAHALATVAKYQDRAVLLQFFLQQRHLSFFVAGRQKGLFHRIRAAPLRRKIDMFRCRREAFDQAQDRIVQSSAHQNRLASRGQERADPFHIGYEAHIQHAIRLVDHQHRDRVEKQLAASVQVQKSARRCNHNIGSTGERADLFSHRHASDQQSVTNPQALSEGFGHIRRLHRKLSRRVQHQRTRQGRALPAVRKNIEQRQNKGTRLAGSRLRNADHITIHQHIRNCLFLNRCRLGKPYTRDLLQNFLAQAECRKITHNTSSPSTFVNHPTFIFAPFYAFLASLSSVTAGLLFS